MSGADAVGMNLKERLPAPGDRIVAHGDLSLAHAVVLKAPDRAAFRIVGKPDGEGGIAGIGDVVSSSCNLPGAGMVIDSRRAWTIVAGLAKAS